MKTIVIVRDKQTREHAAKIVSNMLIDPPHELVIREHVKNRSAAQRRLQWLWNTDIGNHLGEHKDDTHVRMKGKFAVPMFVRDDKEYAQMVETVKQVRMAGMRTNADILSKKIAKLTSTRDFNVKQMCEYLNDMEKYAADIGAELRFPPDIYEEALKRNAPR